jgi:acetamidase/formamidase
MSRDANRTARIEAENRKVGDGAWKSCSVSVRVNNDEWLDLYTVTISVKGLDPASEYAFRFRLTDPDGVEGDSVRSARVKTPKLHAHEPQWENRSTDYSKREPVLRIGDGDTVQTKSWMWNFLNGPFYIEGAEPGDTLAVRLELVEPEGRGESGSVLVRWAVDPQTASELPESHGSSKWTVDREAGMAAVTEVTVPLRVGSESKPTKVDTRAVGLRVPLEPMIGDMGVAVDAPPGKAPHMVDCGRHGGNLDWKGVKTGTTMYYPVYVQGGLYYVSDGHAAQGAGEPLMMGIETGMKVRFTAWVVKGKRIGFPRGEDAESIYTVGVGVEESDGTKQFELARQYATAEMFRWLREDYGLDLHEASILMGMCGDYQIGSIVGRRTVVHKLPKKMLRAYRTPYSGALHPAAHAVGARRP